jgi:L-serine dehydratase
MIGPSGSSFAGPARIAHLVRELLGETPTRACVHFDVNGSYVGCYQGEGSDIGFAGGLLGLALDDPRMADALAIARGLGLVMDYAVGELGESVHPNYSLMEVESRSRAIAVGSESIGGGRVRITSIDDLPVLLEGDCHAIVLFCHGSERLASVVLRALVDACSVDDESVLGLTEVRRESTASASAGTGSVDGLVVMQLEKPVSDLTLFERIPGVQRVASLSPVLPVTTSRTISTPAFTSVEEMVLAAQHDDVPLSEIVLRYETGRSGWTRDAIVERLAGLWSIIAAAAARACDTRLCLSGNLRAAHARPYVEAHVRSGRSILDPLLSEIVATSLGGAEAADDIHTIAVAAPTAGAAGVLSGVLVPLARHRCATDEQVIEALLVAGGIGLVAFALMEPTGEKTGCTGETGTASAMAAAAATTLAGGDAEMVAHAASIALQNMLGLPCDPVAGCIEVPCTTRVVNAATNAIVAADLALSGMDSVIPIDEVFAAVAAMFDDMPANLKGTATGGLAGTAAAARLTDCYQSWLQARRANEQRSC